MQRLLGLSIYILLLLLPAGSCKAVVPSHDKAESEYIEDSLKNSIVSLSDILQDCRFELPQNGITVFSRQGKQHSANQRVSDSGKNGAMLCQQQKALSPATHIISCHMAVAAAQHNRGYYIYALRHIII